jgi:LytS/YehU family sensor histidine kinase
MQEFLFFFVLLIIIANLLSKLSLYKAKFYHSQLIPHALLNDMVFFQQSLINLEKEKQLQYFEYHSSYFQSILKVNTYLTSPLSIELKQANKIVEYFNMIHASNFEIEINNTYSGDNDINIPSLLFQPFIENIFKHSRLKSGTIKINIANKASYNETYISIYLVSDFGYNIKVKKRKDYCGMAIINGKINETCQAAGTDNYYDCTIKYKKNANNQMFVSITLPSNLKSI